MKIALLIASVLIGALVLSCESPKMENMNRQQQNKPAISMEGKEKATLGGGCFWCIEAVFDELKGVVSVESGYSGGHVPNPSYQHVSAGTTGHAEVIQIIYDPKEISFKEILEVFFTVHDPTTLNRQGADVGTQYRSAIYYHNEDQKKVSEQVIKEINDAKIWSGTIVTEVSPFTEFYIAEDYHQEYYQNNPNQPYCRVVVEPKVMKFRQKFREKLKQ